MKYILLVVTLLFAGGCVGPYAQELRLRAAARQSVEVHVGSLAPWGGSRSYLFIDDTIIASDRYRLVRLHPEVAKAAWQAIRQLGLLAWKEHYTSSAVDGQGWSVRLKIDGQERSMRGENAYPELVAPHSTTLDARANAFEGLLVVLRQLEKEPNRVAGGS